MIFVNENNHRVILSARKCGLMSLMSTVPSMPNRLGHIYANKSFTVPFSIHRSLDPWVENTDIMANAGLEDSLREGYPTFDKSAWANYNIVLFIREPYERYISGLWTLWYIRWQGNTNWGSQGSPHVTWSNHDERTLADFNKWYENVLEQTNVYHFLNGHLRPFLHKTVGMEYKTLEVVNSKDLDGYYLVPPDLRDLNYEKFYNQGEKDISSLEDYNSHNTKQLSVNELSEKLKELDIVKSALRGNLVEEEF